jgi:hypothetical protein
MTFFSSRVIGAAAALGSAALAEAVAMDVSLLVGIREREFWWAL